MKIRIVFIVSSFLLVFIYFNKSFVKTDAKINKIEIISNSVLNDNELILYVAENKDIDYVKPYKFTKINDSVYSTNLDKETNLSKFRIYFPFQNKNLYIKSISINNRININLSKFRTSDDLKFKNNILNCYSENGYIESPFFYYNNHNLLFITVLIIIIMLIIITLFEKSDLFKFDVNKPSSIGIIFFIISIYLPPPIYNIGLVVSLIFIVQEFKFNYFISNKMNLLFILYFLILFLNDIFIGIEGITNLKATEKYLPFLILPIYASTVRNEKYLIFFPISAIFLGFGMLITSLINAIMIGNLNFISFNDFTKYVHPVYFSYLLFFSIFFVKLNCKKYSIHLQTILFLFLVLSGSKLVLITTLIAYLFFFFKQKNVVIIIISFLLVLLVFSPTKERFQEVLSIGDLNATNQEYFENPNDNQINGLTIRLILWEESLKATSTFEKILYGNGVSSETRDIMKSRMIKRGLKSHSDYMSHNQYVETFMKSGLIGLISLLSIIIYCFYIYIKRKNKMLLVISFILCCSMLTESVFERVTGIYFFSTVILLILNDKKRNLLLKNV